MDNQSVHILLIEDNDGDVRLIRTYLENSSAQEATNYHITHKDYLSEALQALNEQKFDIILVDLTLPDSSGFDTFLSLYQSFYGYPIIVLTGMSDEQLGYSAVKEGAQDFLTKDDLNRPLLRRAIDYSIERKNTERALQQERNFIETILNTSNALVLVLDKEGLIVRFNSACERLTGYCFEEVKGKSIWELPIIPDNEKEMVKEEAFVNLLKDLKSNSYENSWYDKNGNKRTLAWSNSVLNDVGQGQYIICTGIDITERKNMEANLINAVVQGQEEERHRLARDLHDGLAPIVSSAKMNLEAITPQLTDLASDKKQYLDNVLSLLDNAMVESRAMSKALMPPNIQDENLDKALANLCEKVDENNDLDVKFYANTRMDEISDENLNLNLYRIAQELINNVLKYANASNLAVQLFKYEHNLNLMVEDDGVGFNFDQQYQEGKGFGLKNIESRVKSLQGTFSVDSRPDQGTLTYIQIPWS